MPVLIAGCCAPLAGAVDLTALRTWGLSAQAETEATLRVAGTALYAETASLNGTQSGGINNRAFVWPASTQFRVLISLVQHDAVQHSTQLRQFSDQLRTAYWNNGYRSGAGAGDRFYDDNAHIVVALAEAFALTGDTVYRERAIETYQFVLQGEDAAAGGGIYFKQNDFSSKDTISTLQGARSAAMLYQITQQQVYLDDATRLLTWANTHVQQSDGLFAQGFVIASNAPGGVAIVNSAGIGISTNVELYHASGQSSYLSEAQRIATRAVSRYFDAATGRINDEGYWAYELVDGLNNLYLADGNTLWRTRVHGAMAWLEENKQDLNGHYGLFWGRNGAQVGTLGEWHLNEQAAVARAFLDTAITILPGDINQDGVLNGRDTSTFVANWLSDTSGLPTIEQLRRGDLNLDGRTDLSDFMLFRDAMDAAGLNVSPAVLGVPEPASGVTFALLMATAAYFCRRCWFSKR